MVIVPVSNKFACRDHSTSVNNLKIVAYNAASILPANLKLYNNKFRVSCCMQHLEKRPELVRSLNLAWVRFNSSSVTYLTKDGYDHTSLFLTQVKSWASLIKEQDDGSIEIKLSNPSAALRPGLRSQGKLILSREFLEWFRGFTDAEGCFRIKRSGKGFSFCFSISLHRDDVDVLNYIQSHLKMAPVKLMNSKAEAYFEVWGRNELYLLLVIFSRYNLNTTKHLNFLAWAQAFWLYTENTHSGSREVVNSEIGRIKDSMNTKRISFDLPIDHIFSITPGWLLGFTEGDGTFHYDRRGTFKYQLTQKGNKALMEAIQNYLNSLIPQDKLSFSEDIQKAVRLYNPNKQNVWILYVTRSIFLEYVIIPLFNSRVFHSKKYLDYLDWLALFNIKKKGLHYTEQGKKLIDQITNQMNNNRLTTSGKPSIDRDKLLKEIENFLAQPSNLHNEEATGGAPHGKIWIISEQRYYSVKGEGRGKRKAVTLFSEAGTVIKIFKSYTECGKFLGVSGPTVRERVRNGKAFEHENKLYLLKLIT